MILPFPSLNWLRVSTALLGAFLLISALGYSYYRGNQAGKGVIQSILDVERANHAVAMEQERSRQVVVEKEVLVKYLPKVEYIREKAREIIKEVPVYVTVEDDTKCTVPDGFIWLHDIAASAGSISEATGSTGTTGAASTPAEAAGDNP